MVDQTSVVLFCYNRLLRESVARILNKRPGFQILLSQSPAPNCMKEVGVADANVVVLDSLQLLGADTIFALNRRNNRLIKCVLVAMEDDQKRFLTAIRLGALGYVLQEASAAEVVAAVRAVAQGVAVCPSQYARVLFDYFASRTAASSNGRVHAQLGLSRREQQLVPLIDRGMTNKDIEE